MKRSINLTMLLLKLKYGSSINVQLGSNAIRILMAEKYQTIELSYNEADLVCSNMEHELFKNEKEIQVLFCNLSF